MALPAGPLGKRFVCRALFRALADTLTEADAQALGLLMELGDNDLLDLNLGRKTLAQVDGALVRDDVQRVLGMLRKPIER